MADILSIQLPWPGTVWDAIVSPRGDRIGWITQRENGDKPDEYVYDVWTSNLRGSGINRIGTMNGVTEQAGVENTMPHFYWPQELKWTPNGKMVSFRFHGALWTADAGQ
jgi:hypothetical protein